MPPPPTSTDCLDESGQMCRLWIFLLLVPGLVFADVMEDLLIAARNDNRGAMRTLLDRGMDANAVIDENANSILMIAAREGSETVVTELLARGARLNARNRFGETALMLAAYHGHRKVFQQLLERGAEFNHPGWTPLIYAASSGRIEIARDLLANHAEVNALSPNGTSALMMAAAHGHAEMVRLLLDRGADPKVQNEAGATALSLAMQAGNTDISDTLKRAGAGQ